MNEFEMVERIPNIVKVTPEILSKVFEDKMGMILDFDKTYGEHGADELDCVEIIMELEKILDIVITDDVCEYFDLEMEKRMRKVENNKRSIIESDIDKLLAQEEKISMDK
jgi:acyl carrier protein